MDYPDDTTLIEGLRLARSDAFRQAILRYSAGMLATARSIAGPAEAEDIVQEAWLTVFQRIDAFEQRASLRTWLHRIVVNRSISHLRSSAREDSQSVTEDGSPSWFDATGTWLKSPIRWYEDSPDAFLEADELRECLDKHLQMLPENQRRVVVLRDLEQLALDDICNELDVSASNVRVLLHRGRTRLADMVNHFKETGSC